MDLIAPKLNRAFHRAAILLLLSAALPTFAAPGDLDPTFPQSRPPQCTTDPSNGIGLFLGADGSLFATCLSTATEVIVTKYSGSGIIDSRWGENGISRRQVPSALAYSPYGFEDYDGGIRMILPDGRSIRYRVDGKPDLGYGRMTDEGILGDSIFEPNGSPMIAIQPDGGLLVLSSVLAQTGTYNFTDYDTLILRRLLPNGRRDVAFGNAGELRYRYLFSRSNSIHGFGREVVSVTAGELVAWSLQPDKRLEVLFTTLPNTAARQQPLQAVSLVAGALDPTATGRSFPAAGVGGWMDSEQRVLPDGSQLFARYEVTKWRPDGVLDLSFGRTGRGSTSIGSCPFGPPLSLLAEGGIATYSANSTGFAGLCRPGVIYLGAITANGSPNGGGGYINESYMLIDRAGKLIAVRNGVGGNLVRYEGEGTRAEVTVIEYYHPQLDHYFMTATEQEIQDLDNNPASGWKRTGHRFGAWNIDTPMPGTAPVCRYYGDLAAGPNSHFYSAEKFECDILASQSAGSPKGKRAWRFERDAFRITVPSNGKCPDALQPVYRVFNRAALGKDPNHRYLNSAIEYQAMLARGWADEGVHMCATPSIGAL